MDLKNLLSEVCELQEKGIKAVDLEKLKNALLTVDASTSDSAEWRMKIAELKHQSDLAGYIASQELSRCLLDATMAFAGAALKSAVLINGGAAVAVLAYMGNVPSGVAHQLPYSLLLFTGGVLLAAIATAGSYFAQFSYAHGCDSRGSRFRGVAIALIIGSYVAFASGSYTAFQAFSEKVVEQPVSPTAADQIKDAKLEELADDREHVALATKRN